MKNYLTKLTVLLIIEIIFIIDDQFLEALNGRNIKTRNVKAINKHKKLNYLPSSLNAYQSYSIYNGHRLNSNDDDNGDENVIVGGDEDDENEQQIDTNSMFISSKKPNSKFRHRESHFDLRNNRLNKEVINDGYDLQYRSEDIKQFSEGGVAGGGGGDDNFAGELNLRDTSNKNVAKSLDDDHLNAAEIYQMKKVHLKLKNKNEHNRERKTSLNENENNYQKLKLEKLNTINENQPKYKSLLDSASTFGDVYFVAIVAGCSAAAIFGVIGAGYCFYRFQQHNRATADVDYPAYGVVGPVNKEAQQNNSVSPSGTDRKLAQSAQMYHYHHQKQQMITSDKAVTSRHTSASDVDSDEENEEGDYTVYECPGLASTGEMEVKNPLFQDDLTPASSPQVNGSGVKEK